MKKLFLFLTLALMLVAFSACGGDTTPDTAPDAKFDLDIIGGSYKVVYDVTDTNAVSAMSTMIDKIKTASGVKLSSMNVGNPAAEYEIQFGLKSGRSEGEAVYNEIIGYANADIAAYAIRVVDNKVIIAASDGNALKVAADRFAAMASTVFVVRSDFDETAIFDISDYQHGALELVFVDEIAASTELSEILINGEPIKGFSPDKKEYAIATEGKRIEASAVTAIPKFAGAQVEVYIPEMVDVYHTYNYKICVCVKSADGKNEEMYFMKIIETAPLDRYDLDTWLTPYWEGGVVYHESVMFVGDEGAPLLYTPEHVLSVRSYDLKTEYVEGVDYEVKDGKIYRLEGSAMPHFTWDEFYPKSKETSVSGDAFAGSQKPFVIHTEGTYFHKHQVFVTYKHRPIGNIFSMADAQLNNNFVTPAGVPVCSKKLHKFVEKLERGEEVNLVFFGDSITAGANASGRADTAPGTPLWAQMVTYALQAKYPGAKINYTNTAVGGKDTVWGIENIDTAVNAYKPDLLVLGFGMNDGKKTTEKFVANIKTIIDNVLAANPDCEIAVIGTMLPHSETSYWRGQHLQEAALGEMAKSYTNVDVIPMTSVHSSILTKKRYFDMTGNNVNHPNDFLIRVYAHTILEVLMGE